METTDLIFHLGLTKNASSFLQARVLFGKMNTFARSGDWEEDCRQAREFEKMFLETNPLLWKERGREYFARYDPDPKLGPVIVSHESLYEHIPFVGDSCLKAEPQIIGSRLKAISEHAWPHGETKAWFFFRRQPDWLASIYAHVCYKLPQPSQRDFERRAAEFLRSGWGGAHIIEYDLLVEQLEESLGRGNVLALPFEAMGEEWVWDKVRKFTGESRLIRDERFDARDVNVKRKPGEADWKMTGVAQASGKIARIGKNLGGQILPVAVKRKILGQLEKLDKRRISCPEWLRKEAEGRYRESNNILSRRIGVDLSRYGYC